jgi:hypothetical protein
MLQYNLQLDGLDSFKKAILASPEFTKEAVGRFLTQSKAALNRILIRNPWKVGDDGGGVPVASRHMIETMIREVHAWDLLIQPIASYTRYVHEGTRKMGARPFLDYAMEQTDREITQLENNLIDDITNSLAK